MTEPYPAHTLIPDLPILTDYVDDAANRKILAEALRTHAEVQHKGSGYLRITPDQKLCSACLMGFAAMLTPEFTTEYSGTCIVNLETQGIVTLEVDPDNLPELAEDEEIRHYGSGYGVPSLIEKWYGIPSDLYWELIEKNDNDPNAGFKEMADDIEALDQATIEYHKAPSFDWDDE